MRLFRAALLLTAIYAIAAADETLACAIYQPPQDFINNGDFCGTSGWTLYGGAVPQDNYIDLVGAGAQINQFDVRLGGINTDPRMLPDFVYSLEFQARVSQPASMRIGLFYYKTGDTDHEYDWWPPMLVQLEGANDWRTYRLTFRPRPSNPDRPLVAIYFAVAAGTVSLDKVSIRLTPQTHYADDQVFDIGTFEPDRDYWHVEEALPETVAAPGGGHELKLSLPPNAAKFAYTYTNLDIQKLGWDLEMSVRTSTPENVGRMYVLLRSGMNPTDFVMHTFSGLSAGTNVIKVGSDRTTFRTTDADPDCALFDPPRCGVHPQDGCVNQNDLGFTSGRVCDLYTWWFARDGFRWNGISTVAIKFETNSNGAPGTTTDVYVDNVRLVPWGVGVTQPPANRKPPVVSRAYAMEVRRADGTIDPTKAQVKWQTDQFSGSVVKYGLAPTGYPSSSGNAAESTRSHSVLLQGLQPRTRYHMQVASQVAGGQTGLSGDFTFVTAPSTPPVAAVPGAVFTVGLDSVPRPEDQPMAVDAGFNSLHTFNADGCYLEPPGACPHQEIAVAQSYVNSAAALGVRANVAMHCADTIRSSTWSPFATIPNCPDPECVPPPPGCTTCQACPDVSYIKAKVNAVRLNPGLYGYYLLDEPELNDPNQDYLYLYQNVKNAIDGLDQAHDVVIGASKVTNNPYLPVPDTVFLGNYPSFPERVDDIVNELRAADGLQAPFKFQHVVQAYSYELDRNLPIGRTPSRFPSEKEMRAMAYLGIIYGARGTWFYAMSEIAPFPGTEWNWGELTNLARDLRRLQPVLASQTDPTPYAIRPTVSSGCCVHLNARIKSYQGLPYLLAVNSNDPTLSIAPQNCNADECSVLNANQATIALPYSNLTAIEMVDGSQLTTGPSGLTKPWDPKEAHIYRLEDRASPTAAITFPKLGAKLRKGTSYTISAAATDNVGVQSLAILLDGVPLTTKTFTPPGQSVQATYVWVATKGSHRFEALSKDSSNNPGPSTPVNVTVN